MGKIKIGLLVLCLVCGWSCGSGQSLLSYEQPELPATEKAREELTELALSQVGVRELTGNNDGKEVERYLHSVGLKKGQPWCAALMAWLHNELGIPNPESAWSPDWFRSNVVYDRFDKNQVDFVARKGQVFGLYFVSKKRIAHVGMIVGQSPQHYETVEGNTSLLGFVDLSLLTDEQKELERESIWVAHKIRNRRDIAKVSDFVGGEEIRKGWKLKGYKSTLKIN